MIARLKETGLIWPLIFTLIGLFVLIRLGNWQMERKAWKADLINLVEARVKSEPISFAALKERAAEGGDIRYQPVRVSGAFDHSQERHYFLPLKNQVGWHILTPFKTTDGDVVIVDRGFVPDQFKSQKRRGGSVPLGAVTITGLARQFETAGFFTPANDIAANKWYWRDGEGLYKSFTAFGGKSTASNEDLAGMQPLSFMIDQSRAAELTSGDWPRPGVTRIRFSDKHFGYALTWYGLALTLVGVFTVFAAQRLLRKRG